jgi:hypothetical protein
LRPLPVLHFALAFNPSSTSRRMASERLGSSCCRAAQPSIASVNAGESRSAVTGSLPVAGRPRFFFGITLFDFPIFLYNLKSSQGEAATSAPALTQVTKDANPMTQADRVLSTPHTNTPICQSAPGAVQLSSPPVIPTSPADAGQGVKNEPEPSCGSAILGKGSVIGRRFFMNKLVSLPVAAAIPIAAPALLVPEPATADDSKLLALG